jgi:hypothetical protein
VPELDRIDRRIGNAVVRRETRDHERICVPRAEDRFEPRRGHVAALGIANAESRVSVTAVLTLANDRRALGDAEPRVELRSPRISNAVDGPDSAVLPEVRSDRGMPVLRVYDRRAAIEGALDLTVQERNDLLAASHVQAAPRVGEIVLHVDDDQGRPKVVLDHEPSMPT